VLILLLLLGVGYAFHKNLIKVDFFAADSLPIFYISVEMPVDSSLAETIAVTEAVDKQARAYLQGDELRSVANYAGQKFTQTEVVFGDHFGQVVVSLHADRQSPRSVKAIVASMTDAVKQVSGAVNIDFLILKEGPPAGKAINVKVRGQDFAQLRLASDDLIAFLHTLPGISNISDTDVAGRLQLDVRLKQDKLQQLKLSPRQVQNTLSLLGTGQLISKIRHQGEKIEVIVRLPKQGYAHLDALLDTPLHLPNQTPITLRELVDIKVHRAKSNIRHYNLRRTIDVSADLDNLKLATLAANQQIQTYWAQHGQRYPSINLDFSGELDDIQESLDGMLVLFLFGVGLMYLILGAQFRSYFQPLIILFSVIPLAFIGVAIGLIVSQNPLSMFTLYGVVALTGIAVNAAIVLISAAHDRLERGMRPTHATLYAAKRRFVPILITSLTTIASLFSLATGLAGDSLIWGPIATAIVWGLGFSTVLTLYVIPFLLRTFVRARSVV